MNTNTLVWKHEVLRDKKKDNEKGEIKHSDYNKEKENRKRDRDRGHIVYSMDMQKR